MCTKSNVWPCNHCYECRQKNIRDWVVRNEYESMCHTEKCFLTLTYDNEHLPISNVVKIGDHFSFPTPTLKKIHLQKFFKDLRNDGYQFRYYAVGEYGSQTYRPHYHILLYGLDFNSKLEILKNIWRKGFVYGGKIQAESINYVTRYVEKKLFGMAAEYYIATNTEKEFTLVSKGRGETKGIGYRYYKENIEKTLFLEDELKIIRRGKKQNLPKYFKEKYFLENDSEKTRDYRQAFSEKLYLEQQEKIRKYCQEQKKSIKFKHALLEELKTQRERNQKSQISRIHTGGKL